MGVGKCGKVLLRKGILAEVSVSGGVLKRPATRVAGIPAMNKYSTRRLKVFDAVDRIKLCLKRLRSKLPTLLA